MAWKVCVVLAALLSEAAAFRARHKRSKSGLVGAPSDALPAIGVETSVTSAKKDLVDQLFVFGMPAVSEFGLSRKDGSCIPGKRVFSSYKTLWGTLRMLDYPEVAGSLLGFAHNKMDSIMFDTSDSQVKTGTCPDSVYQDKHTMLALSIHHKDTYIGNAHKVTAHGVPPEVIDVALWNSYERDLAVARRHVEAAGWNMLGSAFHSGSWVGGDQVAHLMQNRSSGQCMLTFQGSDSLPDVWSTLDASKVSFCGLPGRVHKGFRDNMMSMTTSSDWQAAIRTRLPSCSEVWAVGHSMGGGMASLFTACMINGESDDFEQMSW